MSNQVRVSGDQTLPLVLSYYIPGESVPIGQVLLEVNRPNSFILVERYLTEWVPFAFGRTLLLSARIDGGPSGTSSFDLGSGEVALSALQSSALVTVTLPGGALGLRLVLPRLFANLTLASPINLGIFNALVNNAGNNLVTFPALSFSCMSSSAGWPNGTEPFNQRFSASVSLAGAVTEWGRQQTVNRFVTLWNPAVHGGVLVCAVFEQDNLSTPFYRQSPLSLGVVAVESSRFVASPSFGLSLQNRAFSVTLGICTSPACSVLPGSASLFQPCFVGLVLLLFAML